ncbi:MAG TPA: LysM domain-containing protein, partial [Actinotalea sp.]|nr:LysM domain-containing protein [Actinotalea sp.]
MTTAAQRAPMTTARRRAVGGTGVGLALAMASVTAGATPAHAEDYTVRPGDTVSHIAVRTSRSVAQIVAANRLDARASIRVGQRLVIPPAAGAPAAAAPAAPVPAPAAAAARHTVVSGDTVSALAARYRTTTAAIVTANGLGPRALIRIGQVLTIPGAVAAAVPAAAPAPATTAVSDARHTVVSGDTVSALAARYRTTTAAIVTAN